MEALVEHLGEALSVSSGRASDGNLGGTPSRGEAFEELEEGESREGHGEHGGRMKGAKMHEQVDSHGSGSTTGSASNIGSDGTTTGITTGSDGTTTSTSKYK